MSSQSTYTYNWQFQKYVPWKGVSRNEAVPGNARPITNGSWILNQEEQSGEDGNAFLPRPIKHWRRQLNPDKIRGGSSGTVIREVFQPGGTVYLGDNLNKERSCCDNENSLGFKIVSHISVNKNLNCCKASPTVIKPATTILSKKYYTDTKAYLKSRCLLYDQKQMTNPKPGVDYYSSEGDLLYPTNSPDGPQVYLTQNCETNCNLNNQPVTIYKPNNRKFATQGAVDSSTRLDRLKLDTVNKSGASLRTVFGDSAAQAGSYKANGDTPYYIKSNYQPCVHFHRKGHHARCFTINSSDIQRHNRLQGYK